MTVIDTPDGIEKFRLLQLKHAMKLELLGMKHSKLGSIISKVKKQYGFKGNKQSIVTQFCMHHGI